MRWLLAKDLRILRRSPLPVSLLVIYPIAIAVLIGFALSRGPDKPKVAFYNAVPLGRGTVTLGGETIDLSKQANELFNAVDPVRVNSRKAAVQKVRDGDVLGAVVIPETAASTLQSALSRPRSRSTTTPRTR